MFLTAPDKNTAQRIKDFFSSCGYNEETLLRTLGDTSPNLLSPAEKEQAASKLGGPSAARALLQLFFLEMAVDATRFAAVLPRSVREDLEALGLVRMSENLVNPAVLLVPVGDLLVAGDLFEKLESERGAEHVLSVNSPARLLQRFAVRKPVERLLDLCTGNGVQALALADQASQVLATDLNPRALEFARFNAALNGLDNITLREGPGFEPARGERFDQIICNPPYILTPAHRYMCTDNDMELDEFCRQLISESPAHLSEGGVMQMICEWVETKEQDWRARLSEWFSGNGCDAWVICSGHSSVEDYASKRSQQTLSERENGHRQLAQDWVSYFLSRRVTGIRSGVIQLRRRKGQNWQSFSSLGGRVRGKVGDAIANGFRNRDEYLGLDDAGLLSLRPVPVSGLREESAAASSSSDSVRLLNNSGLPVSFVASSAVQAILRAMDGSKTLKTISDRFAQAAGLPDALVRKECCAVVRELLSQGLLTARQDS